MKQLITSVLLIGFAMSGYSQADVLQNLKGYDRQRLHFGFSVGLNTGNFSIRNSDNFFSTSEIDEIYAIETIQSVGFQLGPISNLRLGEYFDLRLLVLLTFSQRDLEYYTLKDTTNTSLVYDYYKMKLSSTFIEFPLQLKYKAARMKNVRPYVIVGVNPKIDLSARKKIPEIEMPKIRLQQKDLYYEFGAGFDFYTPYFKFSTELKYSAGLLNMMVDDETQYTNSVDYLKSNMVMLSFHFE
ncbi:MAG: porin family protein [Bacteroidota bacterium]|nr:porin family protein [Bacteroidota bacterium]